MLAKMWSSQDTGASEPCVQIGTIVLQNETDPEDGLTWFLRKRNPTVCCPPAGGREADGAEGRGWRLSSGI